MSRRFAKSLVLIACVAAAGIVLAGCASTGTPSALAAAPAVAAPVSSAAISPLTQPVQPALPAAVPVAPTPVTPASSPLGQTTATDILAPHFDTPEAAMRYLVAAYNANNETNVEHVTTPDSRVEFEAERQWVKTFQFNRCTPNGAPTWDYTCVLDIAATMPGVEVGNQVMDEVTVIVAPAARPGYYLAANEGCGD